MFSFRVNSLGIQRSEYSYLEAQFAIPKLSMTASLFWVAILKLGKKTLSSSLKIEQKFISNVIYKLV